MIEFLYVLIGFFVGIFFGAALYRNGCVEQIKETGILTLKNKVYSLSEIEAKGEK